MRLIYIFWSYFREVQPPLVRVVHTIVLALVLMQILSSNLISFDAADQIRGSPAFYLGSWAHFGGGIPLVLVGLGFFVVEIARHGVRYFFPYLWGDFNQLKADLKTLRSRRLPEAIPGSLSALVQGLRLGALFLTMASGLGWFLLWQAGTAMAGAAMSLHSELTGLVQAYVIGHGSLGLLHIIRWNRAKASAGG